MTGTEFEAKIQKEIDPRFSVRDNPNRPGLANIFFEGVNYDLPVISAIDIREEPDPNYRYEFPTSSARLWAIPEVIGRLEVFLKQFSSGELADIYKDEN